jgi:hypothetical protein
MADDDRMHGILRRELGIANMALEQRRKPPSPKTVLARGSLEWEATQKKAG